MRTPRHPTSPIVAAARSPADLVIVVGASVAVAAALALVVSQIIDFTVFDLRIRALDSDTHRSIFGVLSLLAQAGTVFAVAMRCVSPSRRAGWVAVGALIAGLLPVRALLPEQPLAFALPVTVAFVLLWWLTMADYPAARTVLRVGLFLLAFSFVVHVVGPRIIDHLGYGYGTWPYEVKGMTKHSTELVGWILLSTGVLAGLFATRRPTRRSVNSAVLREGHSAA
jgi:hypothetical protein